MGIYTDWRLNVVVGKRDGSFPLGFIEGDHNGSFGQVIERNCSVININLEIPTFGHSKFPQKYYPPEVL